MALIPVPAWIIVTLDLRWIRRRPANAIFTHLLLLAAGLIIYDHEIRVVTCSRPSKLRTTPETPDEPPVLDPPALPKPERPRYQNMMKRGPKYGPKRYVVPAGSKRQAQEPNRIADHDEDQSTPVNEPCLDICPKAYVPPAPPRRKDCIKSSRTWATNADRQQQPSAMGLAGIQAPSCRRLIQAPPPASTIDPNDEESVPVFARLMEIVAQRNNWPKPATIKYEWTAVGFHSHPDQACAKGEERWRKWYLPEPTVPDRKRTPYGFCSRKHEEEWSTEWSGVRVRERTPYGYRPESGFTRIEYVVATDEIVVVGIRERTRAPYSLLAFKEWTCILRPKRLLALPAPQHEVSEQSVEPSTPSETPSDLTNDSESDSDDDSSDPLTPSEPVSTIPNELLDYPLPAAPVTGKRANECDLSGSPSKRRRADSTQPQNETGSPCATEAPTADNSVDDSTSSAVSTNPDSSLDTASPQCYTPLKRTHDDSSLDTPSKRHCGEGKKSGYNMDATWTHQDTIEGDPTNLEDHASLPVGIHPVDENNQSDATLLEELPIQQPDPDNLLAASAAAVGFSNATVSAAFAPLSGSSAESFAPPSTSSQHPIVLPPTRETNPGPYLDAPQPFGQPPAAGSSWPMFQVTPEFHGQNRHQLAEPDAFIDPFPPQVAAQATAHSIGAQIGGLGNLFAGFGLTSSSEPPPLDAETEMLVDQAVREILQDEFRAHAGEMVVDEEADEIMPAWSNPDAFAMEHDAWEHTSGEPIEAEFEPPTAPTQEGSHPPMEISSPVLDASHQVLGVYIEPDHLMQDEHQFSLADTPQPFVAYPVSDSLDTAMAPAAPQPVDPPAAWVHAAMAQPLPQSPQDTPEAEDEVMITSDGGAASAAHDELDPPTPAVPPATNPVNDGVVGGLAGGFGHALNNWAWDLVNQEAENVLATPPGSPTPNGQFTTGAPQPSFQLQGLMVSIPVAHAGGDDLEAYEEAVEGESGATAADEFLAGLQVELTGSGPMGFLN
ncbi:hypothetical protein FRC06_005814 [Ceratobasidium sp. 370]|nr:hypothetical protein FRC06_005814 [Ceratobasidium sp. 370]